VSSKHIAIVRGRTRGLEVGNEPRVLGMPSGQATGVGIAAEIYGEPKRPNQ
jgi:hypothetical protein